MTLREARHRARTDLFWFAKNVLGYSLVERVHGVVCNEFFVQKDRRKAFALQSPVHNRLLLDPRGHFKTTLDIADSIQWLLNFPNCRILFMSGTQELAKRMVHEARSHFEQNVTLRKLFPEYAGDNIGNSSEMTVSCRTRVRREPSITISTIGSVKAGSHYDIIKYDDLVHEQNVGTPEQLQETSDAYDFTFPLLDPGGYRDVIGTRYSPDDLYGRILADTRGWNVLARRACKTDKTGAPSEPLLFPERFTVSELSDYWRSNQWQFSCQYLNEPRTPDSFPMTRDAIIAHTVPRAKIPRGTRFAAWDLAFTNHSTSDFTACVVGSVDSRGRLFVLDAVRGRWSPFDIVLRFFEVWLKWRPQRVAIEDNGGSQLLAPGLSAFASEHGFTPVIDWVKPVGPKQNRVLSLDPLLRDEKLWFSAEANEYAELVNELTSFGQKSMPRKDDLADALALLSKYRGAVDTVPNALSVPLGMPPVHPLYDGDSCQLGAVLVG